MKNELYDLTNRFINIEHELQSFIIVITALEQYYDAEHKNDLSANLTVILRQLEGMNGRLVDAISALDELYLKCE